MNYLVGVEECFLDRPAGAARVAWDIARAMADRGHTITLLCKDLYSAAPTLRLDQEDGIRMVRYGVPALSRWHPRRARVHQETVFQALRRHFAGERWDLVHMHGPILGCGVIQAIRPETTCVYTLHSPATLEQRIVWGSQGWSGLVKRLFGMRQLKAFESRVLRRCAAIHVLSDYTRRQLAAIHGLTEGVVVLPHWRRTEGRQTHTREEARRLLGWPVEGTIFFTVRNHHPRCGLEVAIDAIAPLAARGRCFFMIGGDGVLRPALERRARGWGAGDEQVRFLGYLAEEPLMLAYEAADLFILPTLALECFGLIILEALSVGCPVLASDVAAIPELLRPIAPHLLVPPGSVAHLRHKVEAFLDGALPLPSPRQLRDYFEHRYAEDKVAPRMIAFLEQMAGVPKAVCGNHLVSDAALKIHSSGS